MSTVGVTTSSTTVSTAVVSWFSDSALLFPQAANDTATIAVAKNNTNFFSCLNEFKILNLLFIIAVQN